jgi:hypothetical protein
LKDQRENVGLTIEPGRLAKVMPHTLDHSAAIIVIDAQSEPQF